jgi:hypothetical protein
MVVNSQEIEQSEVTFSEETEAATEESSIEVRSESEVNGKSQKEPPKEEEEEEEEVETTVEEVLATHTTDASTYTDENSTSKRKERHEKIRHKRREDPQSFEVERFGVPPPSVVEHSSHNDPPQLDAKSKKEAPHEEPATAVEQVTAAHATDIETHNDGTSSKRKERHVKIRHQRRQEPPEPSTFTGQRFGVPPSVVQVSSSEPQRPGAKSHKEHP